ncbi:hypothetical protein V6N13_060717 [Hibiscus sabdariffa]
MGRLLPEDLCARKCWIIVDQDMAIQQAIAKVSYSYIGIKTYEEGTICRYSVRRSGNEDDKHAVAFSAVNLSVNCSCQMFEFEGVLCRHVLNVFELLNIRELPPQYILPRWLRNAEYRILCGAESVPSPG